MAFTYKLEHEDGTAADPPSFAAPTESSWNAGDTITLGSERRLRVVGKRLDENLDGDPASAGRRGPARSGH